MKIFNVKRFKDSLRPYASIGRIFWLPYTIAIVFTIISAALLSIAPLIFGKLIDIISYSNLKVDEVKTFNEVIIIVLLYLFIRILSSAFGNRSDYIAASKSEEISHYLREKISKVIFHDLVKHDHFFKIDHGKMLSFFSRDIESLWDLFGFALTDLISSTIIIFVLCTIVFIINPFLGLILIIISIFFSFAFYGNGKKVRNSFEKATPRFDEMIGFVNCALLAYETIVSFHSQKWVHKTIGKKSKDVTNLANDAHACSTKFSFITSCINMFGIFLVWVLCLPGLLGENSSYVNVSLGQFVAILKYFSMVMAPLRGISSSSKAISRGIVSMNRLSKFMDSSSKFHTKIIQQILKKDKFSNNFNDVLVKISKVEYSDYSKDKKELKILHNISLDVYSGQMIGLAGESGSGKSTLLRLLGRLLEPSKGSIFYQGRNIKDISEEEFRKIFIYIPQKSAIFPVNLKENLFLGDLVDDNIPLQDVMKKASFNDCINRFSKSSNIENEGLSGGETQRLCLARGFLKKGSLMLVDEPTSALDLTNSLNVSKSLKIASLSKAVIVASHDRHILENCTKIFVLKDGNIVEFGTHDELQKKSLLYKTIIFSGEDEK